jgi:4-oxalocrotonate tautomerase
VHGADEAQSLAGDGPDQLLLPAIVADRGSRRIEHRRPKRITIRFRKNLSSLKALAEGNGHATDVLAAGARLPLSPSLITIEENGNAIDGNSSHRERIQSRAKASDKKLTDAMVLIEGEYMRDVTWVKISEWGIGGQPLTTEAVKDLAAGQNAA